MNSSGPSGSNRSGQNRRAEHEAETVKKKKPILKDETFNKYMPIILVM